MPRTTATPTYHTGVGRRKTAVAQVRLTPGTGTVIINGKTTSVHPAWQRILSLVGKADTSNVSVIVRGGGMTSQTNATTLGIARALVEMDESFKTTLRKAGVLTVDARVKERKKPGLKRARKAPQWSKR